MRTFRVSGDVLTTWTSRGTFEFEVEAESEEHARRLMHRQLHEHYEPDSFCADHNEDDIDSYDIVEIKDDDVSERVVRCDKTAELPL